MVALFGRPIQPTSFGNILACKVCGAFAWKNRSSLQDPCPKRPVSQGYRDQLKRLNDHKFPGTNGAAGKAKAALSALRQPTPEELQWLARCDHARQTQAAKAERLQDKATQAKLWEAQAAESAAASRSSQSLLKEFGILQPETLAAWASLSDNTDTEADSETDSD